MAKQQHSDSAGGGNSTKYWYLGTAVALVLAYFGLIRPAQRHVALLQQQCDRLTAAVTKLDSRGNAAGRGLHLIDMLDKQNSKIASAETALRELVDLRRRLADESQWIATATAALDQLEEVRAQVNEHGRTLADTSNTLRQMDQVATSTSTALRQVGQVATSIRATRDRAEEARGALRELDQLQTELASGLAKVHGTFPTLEPVVEDLQQLCDQLADSEDRVNRATMVGQRLATLQGRLVGAAETLPQAEKACSQMGSLCEKLENQVDTVEVADRQLAELSRLKSDLLDQSRNLPEAAAVLTQVWELRDGLIRSSGTLGEIQHLVVDMVLLEPAVKQAMLSLKPVVEMTRLSRQLESPQIESSTTGEDGEKETVQAGASASDNAGDPQAKLLEMFDLAVAWCQKRLK